MTFKEQLIITIVDKAVIGAVIIIAAHWLAKALERFKSERALANEFAKQRVAKIAEIWTALCTLQEAVIGYLLRRAIYDADLPESMQNEFAELMGRAHDVKNLIVSGRFWLTDTLTKRFNDYSKGLHGLLGSLTTPPEPEYAHLSRSERIYKRCEKETKHFEVLRQSIWEYLRTDEQSGRGLRRFREVTHLCFPKMTHPA